MKKKYAAPVARLIDYQYEEQVKAESSTCSGANYVAQGSACEDLRVGIMTKAADPCWFVSTWQPSN